VSSDPADVELVTIRYLMYVLLPAWFVLTLLCEVNPLLLGISATTAGRYEATAIWDVRSAVDGGREVRPAEQHIHSLLECLPFMAVSALFCLHWDEVASWRCHLVGHLAP
jgi:hypothetical protein